MPGGLALPQLSPGDAVDIVSDGAVVAPGALVVAPPANERGDQQAQGALVAVPVAAAATVATAAQNGGIALVVVPG